MARFFDIESRPWDIDITVEVLLKMRSQCGVNFLGTQKDIEDAYKRLVSESGIDFSLVVDMVWSCVESQAEKVGVDRKSFEKSLDYTALLEAFHCLCEEIQVFFLHRDKKEDARRKIEDARIFMRSKHREASENLLKTLSSTTLGSAG
ncbi:MAG: hypothetical protein KatS3mg105_5021 [Gemmatales bacterium]|nr:MAG: hypothetical protein KatS3mg105_5021 [Gemmatales bacterium]